MHVCRVTEGSIVSWCGRVGEVTANTRLLDVLTTNTKVHMREEHVREPKERRRGASRSWRGYLEGSEVSGIMMMMMIMIMRMMMRMIIMMMMCYYLLSSP